MKTTWTISSLCLPNQEYYLFAPSYFVSFHGSILHKLHTFLNEKSDFPSSDIKHGAYSDSDFVLCGVS